MKMDIVASSKNDEFYTPRYAIEPIIKHLKAKKFKRVWCPFDSDESNFVKMLKESGFEVINTHKDSGQDFFKQEYVDCDVIVSNPPYSIKADILYRLFLKGKPFAMLVGVVGLFESQKRFTMFRDNSFEIMYLDKRISYFKSYKDQKPSINPPFSSVYITSGVLPKQICFESVNKTPKP
jgi:hypothetical protein